MPDIDRYLERGQIEIIPYSDWYTKGGFFDQQRVLDGWVRKLDCALARGYDGLRLTGNTLWLEKFEQFAEVARQLGLYWLVLNEPPPARRAK